MHPPPRWKPAALLSLCALYALYCLVTAPPGPITAPDSAGYLAAAPIHTLGYPLFLNVLGPRGAMVAQPVVFASALAFLGLETLYATSSVLFSALVIVATIATPELATYHASILTESLFMSGLTAFLAAVIGFEREHSWKWAVTASVIAGFTATVRRTGLAFLPVLAIMVLLQWRRLPPKLLAMLAAATVPMLLVIAGERAAARAYHGDSLTNLMGRHLFAKASLIDAPRAAASGDAAIAHLEHQLSVDYVPVRRLLERAPADIRGVLSLYYETCFQGPCVTELGWSIPLNDGPLNDQLVRAARARIFRAPLNFAKLTTADYVSLWSVYKQRHPGTTPQLNAFVASARPLPFEREAFKLAPGDTLVFEPSRAVRFIQPAVALMGWVTGGLALVGLGAAATRRPLPLTLVIACLAALTAHGALLFTALLAAGLSRFLLEVWPAITTAALFGGYAALSAARSGRPDNR